MENFEGENYKLCSGCRKMKTIETYVPNRQICNDCLEKKAQYRENNKDKLKNEAKVYYQNHREEILENRKEKIECEYCRCFISKAKQIQHYKTKKHIKNRKEMIKFIVSDLDD